jgi:ABC-2 type transport system ATP-binding protein
MSRVGAALVAACLLLVALPPVTQAAEPTVTNEFVTSRADATTIGITIFQPATASASSPAPVVLSSHGWAGSRTKTVNGTVQAFLDAGFGIVSIDQRGHGESGGEANVQDPALEAEDIKAVIDRVAQLDWVKLDGPGDPVLGAIGGSYGGGYQTITALDEIEEAGRTRFNALAPEITWFDLPESLAPQHVPRTLWSQLLYAVGAQMLPGFVHEANAWGLATGQWPDGTIFGQAAPGVPDLDSVFHQHSPVAFVERGVKLNVPVLFRQGITDSLFNLNQGIHNYQEALTAAARSESYLVGYNGGHVLPQTIPSSSGTAGDACSPSGFTKLTIDFFTRVFAGQSTDGLLPADFNLTTDDATKCIRFDDFDNSRTVSIAQTVTTTGAGVTQYVPVAQGPVTVTGIPQLSGKVTALGLENRAFFGLAVGTSPTDTRVVQSNMMPLREPLPVADTPFSIELPGIAVEVPAGKTLYLAVAPIVDHFAGGGTKPAGAMLLNDLSLVLPQPGAAAPQQQPTSLSLTIQGNGSKRSLVATLTDGSGTAIAGAPIAFAGDGTSLGTATTDSNGVATLNLTPRYQGGHHHFEAAYSGNDAYAASAASADS